MLGDNLNGLRNTGHNIMGHAVHCDSIIDTGDSVLCETEEDKSVRYGDNWLGIGDNRHSDKRSLPADTYPGAYSTAFIIRF